jgi:tRNA pseudouridine55 synthase
MMMDGVIIIDKPAGKTSHDIVSEVKKILGVRKAGHTGTLDPMATGVLPVCLNEATKLASFLTEDNKEYRATMLLGVKTDTLDTEGKIIGQCDNIAVTGEKIRKVMMQMVGAIKQVPPAYSAVKYSGKPLYKWARSGVFFKVEPREVTIHSLVIEDISLPCVTFRVVCSKGTYIRTLCSDVGDLLGCGACLCNLRRLKSGVFSEEMAVSLNNYEGDDKKNELSGKILPMAALLPLLTTIELEDHSAAKLRNGWQPSVEMMKEYNLPFLKAGDMIKFTNNSGYLLAVAEMVAPVNKFSEFDGKRQAARIVRVFNNINK